MSLPALAAVYDRVARTYAEKFNNELAAKPLDRGLLDAFADLVGSKGRVIDMGCGPGQIAAYLAGRGVRAEGVDISPEMVAMARELHPGLVFRVGDMLALEEPDSSIAGIAAFYAIVHLEPSEVVMATREWWRVLAPGGWLLVTFHIGSGRLHRDEFLGEQVQIDFQFHERLAVEAALEQVGFRLDACLERHGHPEIEYPSLRAYLLARKMESSEPNPR